MIIIAIDDHYCSPPTLRDEVPSFIVDEFNNNLSYHLSHVDTIICGIVDYDFSTTY